MTSTNSSAGNIGDKEYRLYIQRIDNRLNSHHHLFTTDVHNLYNYFLEALLYEQRQFHTCHACRKFVNTYGSLVVIDEHGIHSSALWNDDDAPEMYKSAALTMMAKIAQSKVNGVFYTSRSMLGRPVTGQWIHLSAHVEQPFSHPLKTADRESAEKREDYLLLQRSLGEYKIEDLATAIHLLQIGLLYRSEKVLGVAEWFYELKTRISSVKNNKQRNNLIWLATATAPVGYCYVGNIMIGTLLDDLASGMEHASACGARLQKGQS